MTQNNGESTALVEGAQTAGAMLAQTSGDGMARTLVASGFFPTIKTASQALVKIQAGKELGFGPVASMMGIHIMEIGGKPSIQLSANMIANLVRRGGYDFRVKSPQQDEEECRLAFYRGREFLGESAFSLADAKRAGISQNNKLWEKYPKNMLFAAALRNGAKWFCSEVLLGAPMPVQSEEMPDVNPDTGEIVEEAEDIEATVVREPPEGYEPNWSAFWVALKDDGWTKEAVHAHYGIPPEDGFLRAYVHGEAERKGTTVAQEVAEMGAALALIGPPVETKRETRQERLRAEAEELLERREEPVPLVKQPDGTYAEQPAMMPDAASKAHP